MFLFCFRTAHVSHQWWWSFYHIFALIVLKYTSSPFKRLCWQLFIWKIPILLIIETIWMLWLPGWTGFCYWKCWTINMASLASWTICNCWICFKITNMRNRNLRTPLNQMILYSNLIRFKSYMNFFYGAIWFKRIKFSKSYQISMEWLIAYRFWRKHRDMKLSYEKFPLSLSLSSDSCVFPAIQSNGHSCVFHVFCNRLFCTLIPVRILCFSYSNIFFIPMIQRAPHCSVYLALSCTD